MSGLRMKYEGDLRAVETPRFPAGYSLRPYRPGDRDVWLRIHRRTNYYDRINTALFVREFGRDNDTSLAERMFFVDHDQTGEAIANGTLWWPHDDLPAGWGRIHWIAVVPAHQRRGLAVKLVSHLLHVSPHFGCEQVYLTTGKDNFRAIALYTQLGFIHMPSSNEEEDEED